MSRAINLRVLLPILALFLSADLVASPPPEGVQSIFPLLSDEECWRKLAPTEKGRQSRHCRRGRGQWPVRCPGRRPQCCTWTSCTGRAIRSGRCSEARCDGSLARPTVVNTAWRMPRPTCGGPASTRPGSVP